MSEKLKHECCFEAGQALHCGSDHWWMWVGMQSPNNIIEKYAATIYFCPWCNEKLEASK